MGKLRTVDHKDFTYDNTMRWTVNPDEEFLRAMAASIISQAVEDWIGLIRFEEKCKALGWDPVKKSEHRQYLCGASGLAEIRSFFRSDWGETLCAVLDLDPEVILRRLEKWLRDYQENDVIPKYIHQAAAQRREEKKCSTRKKSTAN